MRLMRIAKMRLRSLFRRGGVEESLDREMRMHLESLTAELVSEGMSEEEARREAMRQFGPVELVKEECRDTRRVNYFEDAVRDVRCAWRGFRRARGFALTAVVSLALGVGANTVVFGTLYALLMRPAPVREPERLQFVNSRGFPAISMPAYRDIRDRSEVFESVFAVRVVQVVLGRKESGARRAGGLLASGNYFQALGVEPALGRFFSAEEDRAVNGSPYVVLSYNCWQSRFGGQAGIVGSEVRVNGKPYQVLGVAPRGFHGTEVFYQPDLWIPLAMQPRIEGTNALECRGCGNFWVAGRLKEGVTVGQAAARVAVVGEQLGREHRMHEGMKLTLAPVGLLGSTLREPTEAFVAAVMLLAGLVLLAACANLAVLQTARAVDGERDLAIRLSIGASRGRIVRQVATESLLLSMLGGLAGFAVAAGILELLSRWRAPLDFPIQLELRADWAAFGFALLASAVTGVLLTAGLARRVWREGPALTIKQAGYGKPGRRWTLSDALLPLQIAMCCAILTASLVAVRGLWASMRSPLGFRPDGVAVASFDVGFGGYDQRRGEAFQKEVAEALSRLPGMESTAYASTVPLNLDQSTTTVWADGSVDFSNSKGVRASYYNVSPGYFRTMGTRLVSGREFTERDDRKSPTVAIVNETFAKLVLRPGNPIGQRYRRSSTTAVEVVGVVEDGKYQTLSESPRAALFLSTGQSYSPTLVLLARSARPEGEVAAEMRRLVMDRDADLAVYGAGGLWQLLGLVYLPIRAAAIALGAFGLLAAMLAVTGIYGLSSYAVARKSKEIGIRMAIGARPGQVARFVFLRLAMLVGAGTLMGLVLAAAGQQLLVAVVYQATVRDPWLMLAAAIGMGAVSLMAASGPVRRMLRIDPLVSLRQD
ncbi:MAG: ABC transporter permease [Acidobacteria bacterium]|nr:ABC transporter permease [Acidobacteriota bacterium]